MTLTEELENIYHKLGRFQQSLTEARLRQQQWTKSFYIYAILVYTGINLVSYAYFLPSNYLTRLYLVVFGILMGALIYGLHTVVCWYFRTSIQAKEERIQLLKERKRELLDIVKEREPYNVAQGLIRRFESDNVYSTAATTPSPSGEVRQRVTVSKPPSAQAAHQTQSTQQQISPTPTKGQQSTTITTPGDVTPGKLPRTILPPKRTVWGMLLDTFVGDGPSKRYAMICKNCCSHNGMALEEEFEYLHDKTSMSHHPVRIPSSSSLVTNENNNVSNEPQQNNSGSLKENAHHNIQQPTLSSAYESLTDETRYTATD
ncbi:unnamed protein product [Didymodactylos carnosus]|uniref:Endoplasmic reticulum junction formation protein lunapark n=1 Tax=Didymodactylos carnosus TaxID=1234261 RepID=A0A814QEK5_9BILA|nr:unnamed protein product [Didymodactylos carnosus]CAF1119263.1 unnamed protein product [Didymodactylos carnosus]CAF3821920.1 unnamed protein product [Didymodactylos carnosus]CAF3882907.1 unnamed protein product [Didymodactylos carnosus]